MLLRHQLFRRCAQDKCKRKFRHVCSCGCQKKLCDEHFHEHQRILNPKLNPFAEQLQILDQRIKSSNKEFLSANSKEKLEQWKIESHRFIDEFYQRKSDELDQMIEEKFEEQQKDLNEIRRKIMDLIYQKETTKNENDDETISSAFEQIKMKFEQFEQTKVRLETRPLIIDERSISIGESNLNAGQLSNLNQIEKTIECQGEWGPALIANEQYLLIDRHPNLCLINRNFQIIKEIPWKFDFIRDMSWSFVLNAFVLITRRREIYLVHEKSLAIELIPGIASEDWSSCTCSETSVYLTASRQGTNLFQFDLSTSFQLIKRWKPPQSCKPYEQILNISYQNSKLAFVLSHSSTNFVHFEVRSSTNLDRLWSLQLDLIYTFGQPLIRCSTYIADQWLLIDNNTSQLFQISSDGQVITVLSSDRSVWNAALVTSHLLAVRTKNSVDFYRI